MLEFSQNTIYLLSLTVGLTATIIYGLLSLFTIDIEGEKLRGYNLSQKIMGATLLLWALHITGHLALNIRYTDNYLATTISLSSYAILISGLELTFHSLLDAAYFTWKRLGSAILRCLIYCSLLTINYFFVPQSVERWSIVVLSIPLTIFISLAAFRSIKRYKAVKRNIDNYYSDDTSEAVEWLRYSLYIMLALGFACIIIPYGSALSDSITMIIAISALTYVMISMRNFSIRISTIYENVENISEQEATTSGERTTRLSYATIQMLEYRLDEWIKAEKFLKPNITIEELAEDICSNRRYISEYLNDKRDLTFKGWIAESKIEYSKSLLIDPRNYTTAQIADMIGYSRSNYNKVFSKVTGQSPTVFRQKAI